MENQTYLTYSAGHYSTDSKPVFTLDIVSRDKRGGFKCCLETVLYGIQERFS